MNPICFLLDKSQTSDTFIKMLHDILIELQIEPESVPIMYDETDSRLTNYIIKLGESFCKQLESSRGDITCVDGRYVMHTFDMARVNRDWRMRFVVKHDINRMLEYDLADTPDTHIKIVESANDVENMINHFYSEPIDTISYDIETESGKIQMLSFAFQLSDKSYFAYVIPFLWGGKYWFNGKLKYKIWTFIKELMQSGMLTKVGHNNWYFDNVWLGRQEGIQFNNCNDTMVMMNIAYPELPKHLNFCRSLLSPFSYYDHLSQTDRSAYCAMDSITTLHIYNQLVNRLKQSGKLDFYKKYKSVYESGILHDMNNIGLATDKETKLSRKSEIIHKIKDNIQQLGFNVQSPQQVMDNINKKYKFKKDMIPDAQMDTLIKKAETDETARLVVETKQMAQIVDNMLSYHLHEGRTMVGTAVCHDADGNVWCGTDAYGYGCKSLQNVPDEILFQMVNVDNGKKLMVLKTFTFTEYLKHKIGLPDIELTDTDIAIITMQSVQTIARLAQCKVLEVRTLIDKLTGKYPQIDMWFDRIEKLARKRVVQNEYGRTREFMIAWNRVNNSTNRDVIQFMYKSFVADCLMFSAHDMQIEFDKVGVKVDWLFLKDNCLYAQYNIVDEDKVNKIREMYPIL